MLEEIKCGIVAICGYDPEYGISPFEDGIKRFCEHFKTDDSKKIAINFAKKVISYCTV